jgi:hypothetical protein
VPAASLMLAITMAAAVKTSMFSARKTAVMAAVMHSTVLTAVKIPSMIEIPVAVKIPVAEIEVKEAEGVGFVIIVVAAGDG